MVVDIKDGLYILGVIIAGVIGFYASRYGIKDFVRDKIDNLKDEFRKNEKEYSEKLSKQLERINDLEKDIIKLQGTDENQQQIINQFQSQVLDHLPKIYEIINNQTNKRKNTRND